jgi:DNA-binding MarR family transcriptional regulator
MNRGKSQVPPSDRLVVLLDRVLDRIRGDIASRVDWPSLGALRPWHLQILFLLPRDGARPSDMAAAAGMSRQALSQWIRELSSDGYLEISTDPRDRRNRIVRPTPKAERAIRTVGAAIVEVEGAWAQHLGARRLEHLRSSLLELRR